MSSHRRHKPSLARTIGSTWGRIIAIYSFTNLELKATINLPRNTTPHAWIPESTARTQPARRRSMYSRRGASNGAGEQKLKLVYGVINYAERLILHKVPESKKRQVAQPEQPVMPREATDTAKKCILHSYSVTRPQPQRRKPNHESWSLRH